MCVVCTELAFQHFSHEVQTKIDMKIIFFSQVTWQYLDVEVLLVVDFPLALRHISSFQGLEFSENKTVRVTICVLHCGSQWSADGQSQLDLLHKDEVILLDFNDNVIGKNPAIQHANGDPEANLS
jgi:hypothetical protein